MISTLNRRLYHTPSPEELPPTSIEAEEAILGGILLDPYAFERACKEVDLTPEVFALNVHQLIFAEMSFLHKSGLPTDFMTVARRLEDRRLEEKTGGQSKLIQLMDRTVSAVNIDEYAKLVFDKYQRRKIIELGEQLTALAFDRFSTVEDMDEKRQELSIWIQKGGIRRGLDMQLLDAEMQEIGEEDSLYRDLRLRNMAKRWGFSLKDFKDMHCKWVLSNLLKPQYFTLDSYKAHCKEMKIDWLLSGFIPRQSQICLYGPGGVGKTRMAHSIIYALVTGEPWGDYEVDAPKRVLVVQSDQGDRENHQMLDIQGFYALTPEQRERYAVITNWTTSKLGYLKKRIEEHKPDLVVFDSLTTVNVDTVTDENSMRYATPLIHWKRLAQEYNCSNIVLHHANKGGGMRGTTAIHNTVDEVWQLSHRTERPNGEVVLTIEKTRSRSPGQYLLKYDQDSWRWNIEGEIEGDDIVNISPIAREIQRFLTAEGQKLELEEIAKGLDRNTNTIRKEVAWLHRNGLISAERGVFRRKVYFTKLRDDPKRSASDRQTIQKDPPLTESPETTALSADRSSTPGKDPKIQEKSKNLTQLEKSKNDGSFGSLKSDEPQSHNGHGLQHDPKNTDRLTIDSGSIGSSVTSLNNSADEKSHETELIPLPVQRPDWDKDDCIQVGDRVYDRALDEENPPATRAHATVVAVDGERVSVVFDLFLELDNDRFYQPKAVLQMNRAELAKDPSAPRPGKLASSRFGQQFSSTAVKPIAMQLGCDRNGTQLQVGDRVRLYQARTGKRAGSAIVTGGDRDRCQLDIDGRTKYRTYDLIEKL